MTKKNRRPILTSQNIRELKSKLHNLKPTVIISNSGLTGTTIQEIDRALSNHELIKVRIHIKDHKKEQVKIINEICIKTNATLIQVIGHIVAVYRENLQNEEGSLMIKPKTGSEVTY